MHTRLFLTVLFVVVAFIFGIVASPYLEAPRHELAEWAARPFMPAARSKSITLYFSSSQEEFLVPTKRDISAIGSIENQMKAVMEELIKGPDTEEELTPTLSPSTTIRGIYTRQETAYVDLTRAFASEQPGGTTGELMSIYSVVNTLLENFPQYSQVQLLLEGKPEPTLAGHIDLRYPFFYTNSMVRPADM